MSKKRPIILLKKPTKKLSHEERARKGENAAIDAEIKAIGEKISDSAYYTHSAFAEAYNSGADRIRDLEDHKFGRGR